MVKNHFEGLPTPTAMIQQQIPPWRASAQDLECFRLPVYLLHLLTETYGESGFSFQETRTRYWSQW